jgi:hypothetical protein
MYYEITLTAVADRDPSCNLLTFTERHTYAITDPPTPTRIKQLCQQHVQRYLEAWPHNRTAKPILVPIDVEVKQFEGRMP